MHLNSTQLSVCTWLSALNYLLFGFHNLSIFEWRSFFLLNLTVNHCNVRQEIPGLEDVVRRETHSWKRQSEKWESLKLKNFRLSWKVPSEEKTFLLKLESFTAVGKFNIKSNLGYTIKWSKLSNFNSYFPTSARTLQLHLQFYFAFSNIPTTTFQHLVLSN